MCHAAEASKRVLPRFVGWYDEAPARRPRRPIGAPAGRIATDRGGASADHAYVTAGWRACRRPDSTKQNVPDSNYQGSAVVDLALRGEACWCAPRLKDFTALRELELLDFSRAVLGFPPCCSDGAPLGPGSAEVCPQLPISWALKAKASGSDRPFRLGSSGRTPRPHSAVALR